MERMITHIWTNHGPINIRTVIGAHSVRESRNSTVNVFRCNNPILIQQGAADIMPQRIAPGGSDNQLQHIAIDQWTQLAHVHRKVNAFAAK